MFSAPGMTPTNTAIERSGALRHSLRSLLSMILGKIASDRAREANLAACMELYHADETRLKEMGLTRMDVVRLLETGGHAVEQLASRSANPPSQPVTPRDAQWHRFPMALLFSGLMRF